jgi:hypothetical protein
MTKSIIQQGEPRCFYCGSRVGLERHHVLGGTANRKLSEKYGLWVYCCNRHHTDPKEGVQYNRQMNQSLKRLAQIAFEARHSRAEWMEAFRKNYL